MGPIAILVIVGNIVLLGAVLWPIIIRDLVIVNSGFGRKIQPISDFPYQCRRISGPGLQACEDMWLSERTRQLFLACSTSLSRKEWMPK
jgi:arylesterase / paraoxonase